MATVTAGFYLVVGQKFRDSGWTEGKPTVRTMKTKPSVAPHEVAVWINVELPEALFKRPNLSATISVPESSAPITITPEVQENIARVVQEQLGITLQISAPLAANPSTGK